MTAAHQHAGLTGALQGAFGLLWAGQTISLLGDGVFLVAFTWQLAVQWQQPALLGLLLSSRVLAELATLALGGWIIDRLPRRSIVLGTDAGRAVLLLALAAALHQPPPVAALALLIVAYGVLTALFRPALVAYLPELVQHKGLPRPTGCSRCPCRRPWCLARRSAPVWSDWAPLPPRCAWTRCRSCLPPPAPPPPCPAQPHAGSEHHQSARPGRRGAPHRPVGRLDRRHHRAGQPHNLGIITAERLALPTAAADRYGQLGGSARSWRPSAPARWPPPSWWAAGEGRVSRAVPRLRACCCSGLPLSASGWSTASWPRWWWALGSASGSSSPSCCGPRGCSATSLAWGLLGRVSVVDQLGSFVFLPVSFAFGGLLVQSASAVLVLLAAGRWASSSPRSA
jgi:hypothetical protein